VFGIYDKQFTDKEQNSVMNTSENMAAADGSAWE
jgi:hypothetical protein